MGPSSVGGSSVMTIDSGSVSATEAKRSVRNLRNGGDAERKVYSNSSHGSRRTGASSSISGPGFPPTHTPKVVEAPDDANSNQEIPPKPCLTSENLHKHQEEHNEQDSDEADWKPPPPTVDERLVQARNFLSDEDMDSQRDFAKRQEAIANYLRKLANEKVPCDIKVYNEVQDMLRVHQSRMNQKKGEILPPNAENLLPRQSVRLALFDTSERAQFWGAPLREDRPPFTIERPDDHDAFIEALRAYTPQGQELRKIENDAYSQTLNDPSLVREHIEEGSQQPEEERFNTRATKRGRKRAAVQLALRSFATNHEQHFEGGWRHRVLRLPSASLPEPSDPGMAIPAEGRKVSNNDDPFEWTKKVLTFQHSVNQSIQTRDAKQPSQSRGVIKAACQARFTFLASHLFNLLYNSPLSRTDSEDDIRYFGDEFIEKINGSGLTSPFSVRDQVREITEYCDARGWFLEDCLTEYANLDLSDIEQLENLLAETMRLHHKIQNEQFCPPPPPTAPKSAKAKGKQRENSAQRQREQSLQELAEPLNDNNGLPSYAQAINLLTNRILQENHENRPSSKLDYDRMWSFASDQPAQSKKKRSFLHNRSPANQEPPSNVSPGKRRATDNPPTSPPSKRQHHHYQSPTHPHPHPPTPHSNAPLPPSRSSTPELGQGNLMPPEMQEFDVSKHGEVLENAPDAKEKHWAGGEGFPFAETGFLAGVVGGRVERDLEAGSLNHPNPAPPSSLASLAFNIPAIRFALPKPTLPLPDNPPLNPTHGPLPPSPRPRSTRAIAPHSSRFKTARLTPRPDPHANPGPQSQEISTSTRAPPPRQELVVQSDGFCRPGDPEMGSGGVVWREGFGEEGVESSAEVEEGEGSEGDLYGVSD